MTLPDFHLKPIFQLIKNLMWNPKILIIFGGLVLCLWLGGEAEAAPVYRETFGRFHTATGKKAAEQVRWRGLKTGFPLGPNSIMRVYGVGAPDIMEPINSNPLGDEEGNMFWMRPAKNGISLFTAEFSLDVSELYAVSYQQRLSGMRTSGGLDNTRLAILIGDTWYISDAKAIQQDIGLWENVEFVLASTTFGTSEFLPCVGPKAPANSGLALPASGKVLAFGVFVEQVNGRVRIDNFTLHNFSASIEPENSPTAGVGYDGCPVDPILPPADDDDDDNDGGVGTCPSSAQICEIDSDHDGLFDYEEEILGTDPLNPDTDGDGHSDGDEFDDGSNPLDSGSFLPFFRGTLCMPWNNFFQMWNVAEHINTGLLPLQVDTKIYNIFGELLEALATFTLNPLEQRDILVHEAPAKKQIRDSYGITCSTENLKEGAMRMTMVQYNEDKNSVRTKRSFQYALGNIATAGQRGVQIVPFNTFNPSLRAADAQNRVANWITVINQNDPSTAPGYRSGRLNFYNLLGVLLDTKTLALLPSERRDIAGGHQFGPGVVGVVEFIPDDPTAQFFVANNRYVFNNRNFDPESIATAFNIPAVAPSGQTLAAPLNTEGTSAILEVANAKDFDINVDIDIYSAAGVLKRSYSKMWFGAKQSRHIMVDSILSSEKGIAIIKGSAVASVTAVAMHYVRNQNGSIKYMYGMVAKEALGKTHFTSFNSFLGQEFELWGLNPGNVQQSSTVSKLQLNGTAAAIEQDTIPAQGMRVIKIGVAANQLGALAIQAPKGTLWWAIRRSPDFVIPLPAYVQ